MSNAKIPAYRQAGKVQINVKFQMLKRVTSVNAQNLGAQKLAYPAARI